MSDAHNEAAELLPCPFCGAEPLLQEHPAHTRSGPLKAMGIPDHPGSWTIECPTDGCCGMIDDTREQVTTNWNRRAASEATDLVAEVRRLRAAIQQTLDENGHLADGDDCTLIALKRAVGRDCVDGGKEGEA